MKALPATILAVSLGLNSFLAYKFWFAGPPVQALPSARDPVVMRTPGGLLEVSTIKAEERFDSTTQHTVFGVPVGATVAQIRVPAVYRYHIPLARDWSLRVMGDTLVVLAPPVQPSLPVAIDTGKLEAFSGGTWSPFTGAEAVKALQKTLTARLGQKAATPELILLQREVARQTVGEFVQKWVVEQPRWKGGKSPTVLVFFEDEPLGQRAAPLLSAQP